MSLKTSPSAQPFRAAALALAAAFLAAPLALAQPTVLTSGLKAPSKILLTDRGNILVAESGNGPNTGRVSIVDRATGARRTLIDNLPSGLAAPNGDPDGPSGLAVNGMRLYIAIGVGDTTLAGPNGTETLNPSPSSALFSSVLQLDLSRFIDNTGGGFALTAANQTAIKNGQTVTLTGAADETASIKLFADFPDSVPDPNTGVRPSHPYGLFLSAHNLYVVDAGMNLVRRVDLATLTVSTVATFAPLPNSTPVGPPFIDAVPDSIRLYGTQLLVPFLPGFPFTPGSSEVQIVDPSTGTHGSFIPNLTSAIDVLPVATNGPDQFLVLEFSTDMNNNKPGRLLLYTTPPFFAQTVVVSNLVTPTNMALDRRTGEVFISQLAPGQILRVDISLFLPPITAFSGIIPVAASTASASGSNFKTFVELNNPYSSSISGTIFFRAQGTTDSSSVPTFDYNLLPFQTIDYPDFLAAMGQTGLGSLDILTSRGAAPVVVASVYSDSGPVESGAREDLVSPDEALLPGQGGTLLAPSNLQRFRFNIGVRTLGTGAAFNVTIRDRSGTTRRTFSASYPANYFSQVSATAFLGLAPQPGDSIRFTMTSGRAIIYGATADNNTPATTIVLATRTMD